MEQFTLNAWNLMQILLTKVYMGNMFQHPTLRQSACEKLSRDQETRLMVTVYIIDPYELRKEPKPHEENPP